jgi:hypothetical protein
MGLAERRAVKQFETEQYPTLKSELMSVIGFEVPIEVDWEALAVADMAHLYREAWPKVYFEPSRDAFKAICADDMGKEALKAALKKIVITNKGGVYSGDRWARFEGGVLTLDHEPCTNIDSVQERADGLRLLMEKAL